MDLDKLLSDHFAVHQDRSFGEKHQDISMRFAIELLKELENTATGQNRRGMTLLSDIENKRLELEMQLNSTQ